VEQHLEQPLEQLRLPPTLPARMHALRSSPKN
jgi:hypothetical protein